MSSPDLRTELCGIELAHPLVNGSGTSVSVRGNKSPPDLTDPRSSPWFVSTTSPAGNVFVGDGGGFLNKWAWSGTTFGTRTTFTASSAISGPVTIDFLSGNLYFGSDAGLIFQITQANLN